MKKKLTIIIMVACLVLGASVPAYGATVYSKYSNNYFLQQIQKYTYQILLQLQSDKDSNGGGSAGNSNNGSNSGSADTDNNSNSENTATQGTSVNAYEKQVAALVNKERQAAGLAPLTVNTKLASVARLKAQDMSDKNYFSHTSPTYGSAFDMMKTYGIKYTYAGENIAKGQKTPESVMNGWMNSSGHRANILNSNYKEIGVGYVKNSNGTTYWVQMFIK